jgi:tRNA nucleotidyltransferase (CCA-adding enzyme)
VGGRPFLAGGAVRDQFFNIKPKDLDVEVFHLTVEQLIAALSKVGKPNVDDRKFGVIRLDCGLAEAVEFALPRKDNAGGERGFGDVFPDLPVAIAVRRRDFGFNAMLQNLVTGEIVDPLNGLADLKAGIIRHCDDILFGQDPLRGIRGFRFAGLIDGEAAPETIRVIRALVPEIKKLTGSAIWSEFEKWTARSIRPSKGLKFLIDTGLIEMFPEIEALIGKLQDPVWHPEGDAFTHTCHVVDETAGKGVIAVLAALCHDFGKATTTHRSPDSDRWISPGHATAGEAPTRSFLARIGAPKRIVEQVVEIVREHMTHIGGGEMNKKRARRLLVRLAHASLDDLFAVIEADHSGRPPLAKGLPSQAQELKTLCTEVENEINPFVMGRHLMAEGLKPGVHFGPILEKAFEAQINGEFSNADEGVNWLKKSNLI